MSEIKRFNHGICEYPGGIFSEMNQEADGDYVLYSEHEAEVARLRAELQNATKAALDATALACEKEREADAERQDAERYRWLLKNWQFDKESPISLWFDIDGLDDTNKANAAIDAAMGASA